MKENSKNKRGISLIVLVITIVVMIILAAVVILTLDSSNIIERANEAKEATNEATVKEIIMVARSEWVLMTNEEKTEKGSFSEYASSKLEELNIDSEDYIIAENGTYELCVVKIGEERFSSLEAAIKTVKRDVSATLVLNSNVSEKLNVGARRIITLDLNGYTLSTVGTAITNSGTLVIKDGSSNKTGMIKAVSNRAEYNAACDFNGNGVVDTADLQELMDHYTETANEENKKYDLDNSGVIAIDDTATFLKYYNAGYAISNSGDLTIENIDRNKITGEPKAIDDKGGTVMGYDM